MIYLWMSIIVVVCYMIGNINFARIFTWHIKKKDITKVGSGNPGMANVLRTQGFGLAILTMIFEFIKGGVPALIAGIIMEKYYPGMFYVANLTAGFSAMLGQIFPVIYKFKGGKGVAVFVGVFFFSPLWWVALILFALCFVIALFARYGAHINLPYVFIMSGAVTLYNIFWGGVYWGPPAPSPYWWVAIIIVWVMFLTEIYTHRKNIGRILHRRENKIDLQASLKDFYGKISKKRLETPKTEKELDDKPEKEIVIEDEEQPTQPNQRENKENNE